MENETLLFSPVWSNVAWPPKSPVISLTEARNWIGIYGDTSIDKEVSACLEAAIEKIASNVGYRISSTNVTDYFSTTGEIENPRFKLSEPGIDTSTIEVKYYQENTGALITLAASKYFLDESSLASIIVIKAGGKPDDISSLHVNPWVISCDSKLENVRGSPSLDRLKFGVRVALNWYWQSRGQLQEARLLDRTLYSILDSCRQV